MDILSPERIYVSYPHINETLKKHIQRYAFASQFVYGRCLDCACGSGYGTAMLSEKCSEVIGVDKSDEAVSYAIKQNYRGNITYLVNDIAGLRFPDEFFNSIVSLETIEHITPDVLRRFFTSVNRYLSKGGVFVCSSPMLRYKDGKLYVTSPYHINEMPKDDLLGLINEYFLDYTLHLYHQKDGYMLPLRSENTGFCVAILRKNEQ